jgi:hypothetical protein
MSIESSFIKQKRFLETIDIVKYKILTNCKEFMVSAYNKLGATKGYLVILANGEVCSKEEAIAPYQLFTTFNSFMFGLHEQGQAEINKPTAIFQDTINLLNQVKPYLKDNVEHAEKIITNINELDHGYKRIREIHLEALQIYEGVIAKELLTEEIVKEVSNLMNDFTSLQYKHLYLQINANEHYAAVVKELDEAKVNTETEDKEVINKAMEVFKYLSDNKYLSGIHESLVQYEKNHQGKQVSFFHQDNWEQKLHENISTRNTKEFQTDALPMLRN